MGDLHSGTVHYLAAYCLSQEGKTSGFQLGARSSAALDITATCCLSNPQHRWKNGHTDIRFFLCIVTEVFVPLLSSDAAYFIWIIPLLPPQLHQKLVIQQQEEKLEIQRAKSLCIFVPLRTTSFAASPPIRPAGSSPAFISVHVPNMHSAQGSTK